MPTWLTGYSISFEEAVHRLLWRQWSLLGVAGAGIPARARTILDPESLLLFTLEAARTEPRLFDEVLDWLLVHGHWIDVQRLRNLVRDDADAPVRLLAAIAAVAGEKDPSAKWGRLATPPRTARKELEPLFLLPGNPAIERSPAFNSLFARYGYRRHPLQPRGLTGPIPTRLAPCLRLRLRALFGIGIRAEALSYLLTGATAHVKALARAIGYSLPGTLQALRELAASELVHVRSQGREKHYWVHAFQWWQFLGIEEIPGPGRRVNTPQGRAFIRGKETGRPDRDRSISPPIAWADWRAYYRGLAVILRFLRRADLVRMTAYVAESELSQAFLRAEPMLTAAQAPFQPSPTRGRKAEDFGRIVLASIAGATES